VSWKIATSHDTSQSFSWSTYDATIPGIARRAVCCSNTCRAFSRFSGTICILANADDPVQDADYREYRALMEADPEWHDGEIESF
jgi:hypothetical protein